MKDNKYIEFGRKYERVWVIDDKYEMHLTQALSVRGFPNVRSMTAMKTVTMEHPERGVWGEMKLIDAVESETGLVVPDEVFFLTCRDHPLKQSFPIAASVEEETVEKARDAMQMKYPQWEYEVESKARPE